MGINKKIKLLAEAEVPPGTSKRFVCLKCNGGTKNEKSLSITSEGNKYLFKCFRDTCDLEGCYYTGGNFPWQVPKNKEEKRRPFTGELSLLGPQDYELFWERYELAPNDLDGVKLCPTDRRYLLPVYGPRNQLRGHIARSFWLEPKALTYITRPEDPFVGWFYPFRCEDKSLEDTCILVEDWFSAAKVARAGIGGISLNGTHLTWETATEIAEDYKEVIIALDKGALQTAINHYKLYSGLWDRCRVVSLEKDLKYVDINTITNAASNRETTAIRSVEESDSLRRSIL